MFLHGTAIMHPSAAGASRLERVAQVRAGEPEVGDFAAYVPTERTVEKLRAWRAAGAEITYLSSHREARDVEADRAVLRRHGFPAGEVFFRLERESYGDVAARAGPNILVEDDCESIGGEAEMTGPRLPPGLRARVAVVVVPEFGGLGSLPDEPAELVRRSSAATSSPPPPARGG